MKKAALALAVAVGMWAAAAHAMDLREFNVMKYNAEQGDPRAALEVGNVFLNGSHGIEQNDELAFKFFNIAAEKGDPQAMFLVAQCYMYGKGVGLDMNEARKWMQNAANRGNPQAAQALGTMAPPPPAPGPLAGVVGNTFGGGAHPGGWGGWGGGHQGGSEVDQVVRRAQRGDSRAMYDLGMMYFTGSTPGVQFDGREAFHWFMEAANHGNGQAMHQLAIMYGQGAGVPRNLSNARHWEQMAREHGYSE